MKKIQMVDVVSQYMRYESEINNKILNVVKSGAYIQGVEVQDFEFSLSQYLKSKYVISCANGTDALYVALMSLNLKEGDEVIVPTFTFVSTVEVVCLLGLKPVFIDVDKDTFLINPHLIEKYISKKTRAIIPVHLFGQCCDMYSINLMAQKYNLFIIEDAAQSIGSQCMFSNNSQDRKFSGTIGDIGITSFYPSKNLGCFGDGGAIFTQNNKLSKKIRLIVNHGQKKKYSYDIVGLNSRLDALQAAVLSIKLQYLDLFNHERQKVANYYDKAFSDIEWITTPTQLKSSDHVYHQYSILLSSEINRDNFSNYLFKNDIPTMIYYPKPLHLQKAYSSFCHESLPVSEMLSNNIISLPIHSEMNMEQLEFICSTIKKYVES